MPYLHAFWPTYSNTRAAGIAGIVDRTVAGAISAGASPLFAVPGGVAAVVSLSPPWCTMRLCEDGSGRSGARETGKHEIDADPKTEGRGQAGGGGTSARTPGTEAHYHLTQGAAAEDAAAEHAAEVAVEEAAVDAAEHLAEALPPKGITTKCQGMTRVIS